MQRKQVKRAKVTMHEEVVWSFYVIFTCLSTFFLTLNKTKNSVFFLKNSFMLYTALTKRVSQGIISHPFKIFRKKLWILGITF